MRHLRHMYKKAIEFHNSCLIYIENKMWRPSELDHDGVPTKIILYLQRNISIKNHTKVMERKLATEEHCLQTFSI